MQFERKKETTEVVDIPAPSYWKDRFGMYHFINFEGILIQVGSGFVGTVTPASTRYSKEIDDVISGTEITEKEFKEFYVQTIGKLNYLVA